MPENLTDLPIDLSCSFEDAERNHLVDGLQLTLKQRVAWFEEATRLVYMMKHRGKTDESSQ